MSMAGPIMILLALRLWTLLVTLLWSVTWFGIIGMPVCLTLSRQCPLVP